MTTNVVSVNELFSYIDGLVGAKSSKVETESEEPVEEGFQAAKFGGIAAGVELDALDYLQEDLDNVVRVGLLKSMKLRREDHDISFWTSLMYCCGLLDPTDSPREQNDKVRSFLLKMQEDYNREKLFTLHNLKKYKWRRRDILDQLQGFQTTESLKVLVSNYLGINILVADSTTGDFTAYYPTEIDGNKLKFNVFNMTVMVLHHDNCYEPIVHSDRKSTLWTMKSEIIKHLLYEFLDRIVSFEAKNGFDDTAFSFTTDEDLTPYLPKEKEEEGDEDGDDNTKEPEKSEDSGEVVSYGKKTEKSRENQFEECDDADSVKDVVIDEDDVEVDNNDDADDNSEEEEEEVSEASEKETNKKDNDDSERESGEEESSEEESSEEDSSDDDEDSDPEQDFDSKSSLTILQSIATKRGISLVAGKYKNGADKMKTKKQLLDDLS